jgi:predicted XRE-type DNA-binding protein
MALPDPILELKRSAAVALSKRISGWASADDAATLLGTQRARVVDIRSGRLDRFSLETRLRYLVRAGARVELRVTDGGLRGASHARLVDGD